MDRFRFTVKHLLCALLIVALMSALVRYASTTGPFRMVAAAILFTVVASGVTAAWGFALPVGFYLMGRSHPLVKLSGLVVLLLFLAPFVLMLLAATMIGW